MRDLKFRRRRIFIQIFLFKSWSNQWTQNKKGYEVSRGIKFKFKLILSLLLINHPSPPTCLSLHSIHVYGEVSDFLNVYSNTFASIYPCVRYNAFELFQVGKEAVLELTA